MKIIYDDSVCGLPEWELKPGDVVEVLKATGDKREGDICIVAGAEGSRDFFVSLVDGYACWPNSETKVTLLDAELTVKKHEGR